MEKLNSYRRIVIKIGTSTLTHATGYLNLRRIERLSEILSDLKNEGRQVILVSSGAVSCGAAKLKYSRAVPWLTEEKQALAAVGQSELMKIYGEYFGHFGHTVAQILMTKDVIDNPERRHAAENTFRVLLETGCLPIVNENDSVSTTEIKFGGNDTLSAYVAQVAHADLLINLSDVDGLYDDDPRKNPAARLIPRVENIDRDLLSFAGGAGSARGTGGMQTKLEAAAIATAAGIPMFILNGKDPAVLYRLLDGEAVGTYFPACEVRA